MSTKYSQGATTNAGPIITTTITSALSNAAVSSRSRLPKLTTSTPQPKTQQSLTPAIIPPLTATTGRIVQRENNLNALNVTKSLSSLAISNSNPCANSSASLQSSNLQSNSPISKRQANSNSITRIRPQSSYSARVLIFEDSDHDFSHEFNNSCPATSLLPEIGLKSTSGLDFAVLSPKKDSTNFSSQSLMRNFNLTKSSSGGLSGILSGSSVSLAPRGYGAFLRKLSYNQYSYSLRSASSGMFHN